MKMKKTSVNTREKLFEMMEKVNKIKINENKIPKKEDSQPFGGSKNEFQDGNGYVDEKPVNPKLRVKSDALDKYVKEDTEGEKLIKKKFNSLHSDLDFSRMADAYQKLNNIKNSEFKVDSGVESVISTLTDLISKYLRNVKQLNVKPIDVKNFFDNSISKNSFNEQEKMENDPCWKDYEMVGMKNKNGKEVPNCVPKNENQEIPALDVNDVDDDGDRLEGGAGDNATVTEFNPEQVLMGIEHEMEHTKDPRIALEIALDHLCENPNYYTELKNIENDNNEKSQENEILGFDIKTPNFQ